MKNKTIILFSILFYSQISFGEYRVYQYYVRSKIQNLTIVQAELITSTLNPVTYVAYHGGDESVEVSLLRSWQCMGNTSKEPVCSISPGNELNEGPNIDVGVKP